MRKKILVISHERSGTHFLINTIAQCFNYLPDTIDLVHTQGIDWSDPQKVRVWLRQYEGSAVANVFKSHHAYPFFATLLSEMSNEFTIFYIRRDGRDVMTSFWTYLNRLPARGWGPRTKTVGEFMRAISSGRFTQYQAGPQQLTMLERWVRHVDGWSKPELPVHHVSYEMLHANYDVELEKIAQVLGEAPIAKVRPTLESPSSLPWRGDVGTWKEFFTDADNEYFAQNSN